MCDKNETGSLGAGSSPVTGRQWDPTRVARALDAEQLNTCKQQANVWDPHRVIDDLIEHHNRMANDLNRLKRAIPEEMGYEAQRALMVILNEYSRHKVF